MHSVPRRRSTAKEPYVWLQHTLGVALDVGAFEELATEYFQASTGRIGSPGWDSAKPSSLMYGAPNVKRGPEWDPSNNRSSERATGRRSQETRFRCMTR